MHMYDFGVCPQCKLEISQERQQQLPVVCDHCGWIANLTERQQKVKSDRFFIKSMLAGAFVMVLGLVGLIHWDTYILEAVPLKVRQTLGIASPDDLKRITEICEIRGKIPCMKQALFELSKTDSEASAQLGKVQYLSGDFKAAAATFTTYFQNGGVSLEASYDFARSLERLGDVEMASRYYQTVIDSKPDVLQITVTKNYIQMLMEHNRRDQAQAVLENIRKKGANTSNFMDPVFLELKRLARQ